MATHTPEAQESRYAEENVSPLFKQTVDFAARSMDGAIIENHNIRDAWYLVKVILEKAADKRYPVTILSGRLYRDFYNSLGQQLEKLLKKNCPVKVYLSEADEPDGGSENEFARILKDRIKQDKKAGGTSPLKYKLVCARTPQPVNHLIYAGEGGQIFRFETDLEKHSAFGAFGVKDAGQEIVRIADSCIKKIEGAASQESASYS